MLLWIWLVHNLCWKLECWLYIFATARSNCKSFSLPLSVCQLNSLRTSKGLSLGELIRLHRIYFSKHFCPCFATCMIWMELTRTDAVSAELPWCYFCAEIKVLGMTWKSTEQLFVINKNIGERINRGGPTCCPEGWGCALPPWARPPTSWPP